MWRQLWACCLDVLYPPRCVVRACRRRGAWWCTSCQARILIVPEPLCARCGGPVTDAAVCRRCQISPPSFGHARAVGQYAPPLRDAIHALKYHRVAALAPLLGARVARVVLTTEAHTLGADPLVVAVPAHRRRRAARGVDHARLLADAVARTLGADHVPGALVRTRRTAPQVGLTPPERRANVAGAFRAMEIVRSRPIILVDDVMTTGATADACSAALLAAGAERVTVYTVARAIDV